MKFMTKRLFNLRIQLIVLLLLAITFIVIKFIEILNNKVIVNFVQEPNNYTFNEGITYPNLLNCHHRYVSSADRISYDTEADVSLHRIQIVRGIIIYYPALQYEYFEQEFRWLYLSWVEMQKYEPVLWRTDLVVFTDYKMYLGTNKNMFQEFNCSVNNTRRSRNDEPMCTILNYVALKDRQIPLYDQTALNSINPEELYHYLFKNVDAFIDTNENLWKFYGKLKELKNYNYLDSILIGFDGYKYFETNFDFLLRTDMDIFLTPFFAKWLPLNCNDFITGSGAYSHDFNMKRLRKAAKLMKLEFGEIRNLGSTWFSTPSQIRLVSYLTLVAMAYINSEEFSEPERQSKVGTILWPGIKLIIETIRNNEKIIEVLLTIHRESVSLF